MIAGRCVLYTPKDAKALDVEIMEHMAMETNKLFADGMCDLDEYGTGDAYEAIVAIRFQRKEDK